MNWTKYATIDKTFERAAAEQLGISKHFIRHSVLNGSLPSHRAGKKYLIDWDTFVTFLENPKVDASLTVELGGIRRVAVKGGAV